MCFIYHLGAVILCALYFTAMMVYYGACSLIEKVTDHTAKAKGKTKAVLRQYGS